MDSKFIILKRNELLEKALTLPLSFGVYIMRDRNAKVIYVGKSRALKNRVSQYFRDSQKDIKCEKMVSNVASSISRQASPNLFPGNWQPTLSARYALLEMECG